jgi:hypothetical protein
MPANLSDLTFTPDPLPSPYPDKRRGIDRARGREPSPRTNGHRREVDPRRDHISFQERLDRSLLDVGIYRVVSLRDLVKSHFDGHPYVARRAVDALKRDGLLLEHTLYGPKGAPFKALSLTPAGSALASQRAAQHGLDPQQETWTGLVKRKEVDHDLAIYPAVRAEIARLRKEGATIRRIRIDAELKQLVAKRTEIARARAGRQAADLERLQAAQDLGLPVEDDKVLYPDAQIEYDSPDGLSGRANVEVVSGAYRAGAIAAKARAGFSLYGTGGGRSPRGRLGLGRHIDRRTAGGISGARSEGSIEL